MNDLKKLSKNASQCVKCGTCLAHCPIYAETLSEPTTARGKLSLVESLASGNIQFTKKLNNLLFSCLICNTCGENCPNDVNVGEIILEARRELIDHRGLPITKKFLFRHLLNSIHALPLYLQAGSLMQGLLLKKIPKESGLQLRFSLPFLDKKRLIPALAKNFFCEHYSPAAKANIEKKRVGYFVGCATNYLFPHIGEATLRILNKYGVSVSIPSDQKCCGLIAFGSGDWQSTQKLALSNIEAFEQLNLDTIVTTCASCAATLKTFYPKLFEDADDETQKMVERFSHKIMDISQFLTQEIGITSKLKKLPLKKGNLSRITYHDPCHLNRTLGITKEPREILKSLSNLEFVEMNDASRCCGMGGTFNITHYDLSMNILKHKLDTLETLGVEMIATGCSGCIFQFMDGIHQRGLKTRVVHIVEALEMG
jgi:glycolate oxidase iron-sulfur subunit